MLDLLKRLTGWPTYSVQREPRNTDPRAARHWHNPADPVQAARIEAAAAKRERKASKLRYSAVVATDFNRAHHPQHGSYTPTLDPFHVAH